MIPAEIYTLVVGVVLGMAATYLGHRWRADAEAAFKVADYRHTWINSLRDSLADFHSYVTALEPHPFGEAESSLEARRFFALGTRVKLLLNPDDKHYEELAGIVDWLMDNAFSISKGDESHHDKTILFVRVSQSVIKGEWDRLRRDVKDRRI